MEKDENLDFNFGQIFETFQFISHFSTTDSLVLAWFIENQILEQKEKEVTFDDLIRNAEKKAEPAPDSKLDQLNSLRAQIAIEEQKILSCGQCSEAEMLKRQTAALYTLLKVYNGN